VRAVRRFFDGPLVLAGGIGDGQALAAALTLRCDLGYRGTRFITTSESMTQPHDKRMLDKRMLDKRMLVDGDADDFLLTRAFAGLQTAMLRLSIVAAGLDPDVLPERGGIDVAKELPSDQPRRWRDIWIAGHSVSAVEGIVSAEQLIGSIASEYETARAPRGPTGPPQRCR
jgi:nitronate monooxygenase